MLRRSSFFLFVIILSVVLAGPAQAADSVKIVIYKKVNKLAYFQNGVLAKEFPVATGRKPSYTPEGTFKVVRKLVRPYYSKLKIPGGSPQNPLGERWLGFNARGTSGGTYGIHGTNSPDSIGKYQSGGCIRMFNQDVIWLYDHTPMDTMVVIINEDWDIYQRPVTILVNGQPLQPGEPSGNFMQDNKVMVPCRKLAEALGWEISWEPAASKVTVTDGNKIIYFTVNSSEMHVNGRLYQMAAPVLLEEGTTYVHVRAMAEAFGYQVVWDGAAYTVNLISNLSSSDAVHE